MKLESFIAKRYLVSKHKINFITIISVISVIGITIGVAALIVVLSVFNGFGSLVTSFLISFDPYVRIEASSENAYEQMEEVRQILETERYIVSHSPFVSGKVLAMREGLTEVINLKGINEISGTDIYDIKNNIIFGSYKIETENSSIPNAIIGIHLADQLQALIGDTITIISPVGIERMITQFSMPLSQRFIIAGIYSSNNNEYDASFLFTDLKTGQRLLGYRDNIQGFEIRLNNLNNAFSVKHRLEEKIETENFVVNTWYDFHRDLYSVMQIERWAAYIILSLIIAVATFNILGSLSMSVIEKKRDIGILRAMGLSEKSVLRIFMFEGLLVGIIGTIAGALLGYFICFLQIQYNIYPLDPTQYKVDSLPLEVRISDFFFISGMAILLSFLASLFPAKRATKVNPLEAIKWE